MDFLHCIVRKRKKRSSGKDSKRAVSALTYETVQDKFPISFSLPIPG